MVKFIHCADIHLGRVQNNLEQRFVDFGNAFRHVVQEALARKVDFMLVSGDLFDKRNINARTLEQAVEILEPLKEAGIPVIAIEGNHDKAFLRDKESWMTFLARRGYIILLSPEFQGGKLVLDTYDRENCTGCYIDLAENVRVYGLGYLGRAAGSKLEELAPLLAEDKTNIVLLHAMVGRMGGELIGSIPKSEVACLRERVAYLALGHGHNRYVVERKSAAEIAETVENGQIGESEEVKNQVGHQVPQDTREFVADNGVVVVHLTCAASDCVGAEADIQKTAGEHVAPLPESTELATQQAQSVAQPAAIDGQIQLSLFDLFATEELVDLAENLEVVPALAVIEGALVEVAAAHEMDESSNPEAADSETELPQASNQEDRPLVNDANITSIPNLTAEQVFDGVEDYCQFWGHNPGAVEHCRLDEANHHQGCFYVELVGGEAKKIEHIPAVQRPARMVHVDISGLKTPDAAYEQIFSLVRELTSDVSGLLLRLIITGEIGFDIIELDEEVLRAGVEQICAPLILEIDVRANLPGFTFSQEMDMLDRYAIEQEVLRKKVENRSDWRHLGDALVDLLFELKEELVHGLSPEEVVAKVMAMVGDGNENS